MRKVMIFHDNVIGDLEHALNEWFASHPVVEVWKVLQSQSAEGRYDGESADFTTWLTITLFYSEAPKMESANAKI